MKRKVVFTKTGLDKLKKEHQLLNEKRADAVAELSRARDMGDRSENAAYKSARATLSRIDSRLRYMKSTIDHAVVAHQPEKGVVGVGSKVQLKKGSEVVNFDIVGDHESDINNNKLSQKSPLGRALIGKKKGETIILIAPAGRSEFTIQEIT